MKTFQNIIVILVVLSTLAIGLTSNNLRAGQVTETRTFCAYGRIFVEFEENGKVWGTLMLDFRGQPIPCREDSIGESMPISDTI